MSKFRRFRTALAPRLCLAGLLATGLANAQPANVSVSPSSGSGTSQTFAFTGSSPNGYSYLWGIYMIFNYADIGGGACYLLYNPGSNVIQLSSDNGQSWASSANLGSGGSIQNSQCSVNPAASWASGSGNNLTVNVALTFEAGLPGPQNIYMETVEYGGGYAWYQQMGVWTTSSVSPQPPSLISITPSSGTGQSGTFSFVTSSPNGWTYLMEAYAMVETPGIGAMPATSPTNGEAANS